MTKKFLFIIPLTPDEYLTDRRLWLRTMCLQALKNQRYQNWNALLIGDSKVDIKDERFIKLAGEGTKLHKLGLGVDFIKKNNLHHEYLIRLDDDDIFSSQALDYASKYEFDIFVDRSHYFLDCYSGLVASQIRYWFPNTSIQKSSHALALMGENSGFKSKRDIKDLSVLESDHSRIHRYYRCKRILYAAKGSPVYLRILNRDSITAKNGAEYLHYLNSFGVFRKIVPKGFENVLAHWPLEDKTASGSFSSIRILRYHINQTFARLSYARKIAND